MDLTKRCLVFLVIIVKSVQCVEDIITPSKVIKVITPELYMPSADDKEIEEDSYDENVEQEIVVTGRKVSTINPKQMVSGIINDMRTIMYDLNEMKHACREATKVAEHTADTTENVKMKMMKKLNDVDNEMEAIMKEFTTFKKFTNKLGKPNTVTLNDRMRKCETFRTGNTCPTVIESLEIPQE